MNSFNEIFKHFIEMLKEVLGELMAYSIMSEVTSAENRH